MKLKHLIMIKQKTIIVLFILVFGLNSFSQESNEFIDFEASYVSDMISNFSGGLNQASAYLGMIDLIVTINTKNAGLWKNGELYVQIENTHGANPAADIVGDFQCFSNIDNGDYTYLYQLWYHHNFNKLSFTVGIHDLNSEFFVSEYSGEYVNSSFGIMPVASMNVSVPIFPKNVLGFIARYDFENNFTVQAAIYDGNPLSLDEDPYGMNYSLSSKDGFFSVGEVHYNYSNDNNLNGTYKLGGFYHNGDFDSFKDTTASISGNYGFYIIADQKIISIDEEVGRSLGLFTQIGVSPKDRSINSLYWALGINFYGPFVKRAEDVFGIAVANALMSSYSVDMSKGVMDKSEIAIECFYKLKLTENISLQPEVQYIINPGVDSSLNNAFVGLIRTYISF